MKRISTAALVLLMAVVLAACGQAAPLQEATPAPTQTIEATPAPTPTPTPTPMPTPTPTPVPVSHTTGLPYDGAYQPVIAVIENLASVRPQFGLQTADVVYEVPVEGSNTRFVCVFSDNVPEEVLPVLSARVPFLYIQNEWNAVFMHFGGSGSSTEQHDEPYSVFGHPLREQISFDVDGWTDGWGEYFDFMPDIASPHNVMGYPKLAQELYDYEPEPLSWQFDETASYDGTSVSEIKLPMGTDEEDFVSYTYDAQSDEYLRFMGGEEFASAETGQQMHVKNIIVQYSSYTISGGVKLWEMTGGGDADIYIGGKLTRGSWAKETAEDETVYYDGGGKQIVLRPGNTWIHIHPAAVEDEAADEADDEANE